MNNLSSRLSVLMSVYKSDLPENFDKALASLFQQSLQPSKVVLIKDGPISSGLENVVAKWMQLYQGKLIVSALNKNCGLAVALNRGLELIDTEFIARMDSDDIALPNRFEQQINFLINNPEVDVVGSWITEIDESDKIIKEEVVYPTTHKDCYNVFAFRDPVAHPSVIFRSRYFAKVGKYSERHVGENKNEDTDLWFRGFKSNCRFANIPEVLLHFRRSDSFYRRRSGLLRGKLIFKDRLRINRELGYGVAADLFALAYFLLGLTPAFAKRLLYQYLR